VRPIAKREIALTAAAIRFSSVSSSSLVAALRGTGEYATVAKAPVDREGMKRVLRHRGYTFQGRHIFGPPKDPPRRGDGDAGGARHGPDGMDWQK
jgi:hypothetical protein